jgi:hypothetical protein
MFEKSLTVKNNIIKATSSYLNYHEDNQANWDDNEKKIAEETIGLLVLSGQRLNDIQTHYKENDNIETLPEGFPDKESLISFINYFEVVGIELLKQIPQQYHSNTFE